MNQRVYFIDIAKGFGILSIVLLHIVFKYPNSQLLPLNSILGDVWKVTVFFVIGGFFIKDEQLVKPFVFFRIKFKSIYKLLLYFYIAAVLLHNFFINIGFYSETVDYIGKNMVQNSWTDTLKGVLMVVLGGGREPIVGPLWFVYVLFFSLMFYSIVSFTARKLFKDDKNYDLARLLILLSATSISCILTQKYGIFIPRVMNSTSFALLIYIGNMMYQRFKLQFNNPYVLIAFLIVLYQYFVIYKVNNIAANSYNDIAYLVITTVGATYVLCFIGVKISYTRIGKILAYCGNDSFYIMALHFIGFKLGTIIFNLITKTNEPFSYLTPTANNIGMLFYYFAWGIIFPLVFMWLFRQLKNGMIRIIQVVTVQN
ncbi:MAG TPA: acyltransferase family protein [Paludibacter sp.]|nr:acyltransferase family protein [Paludibacter sp.]